MTSQYTDRHLEATHQVEIGLASTPLMLKAQHTEEDKGMTQSHVSSRRLVANSLSAMLSAVEVYNKPRMEYRDEVTVVPRAPARPRLLLSEAY